MTGIDAARASLDGALTHRDDLASALRLARQERGELVELTTPPAGETQDAADARLIENTRRRRRSTELAAEIERLVGEIREAERAVVDRREALRRAQATADAVEKVPGYADALAAIEAARKVVAKIMEKVEKAEARVAALGAERGEHTYAAATGDVRSRQRLASLGAQQTEAGRAVEDLKTAQRQADAKLAEAEAHAEQVRLDGKLAEARELAAAIRSADGDADEALTKAADALQRRTDLWRRLAGTGCLDSRWSNRAASTTVLRAAALAAGLNLNGVISAAGVQPEPLAEIDNKLLAIRPVEPAAPMRAA